MSTRRAAIGGLCVTALTYLVGACGSDGDGNTEPNGGGDKYALERDGAKVEPTAVYRECSQDADCTLVGVDCNGCCGQDAIASRLEDTYEKELAAACEGYQGPVCDCDFKPLEAKCESGKCTAVPMQGDAGSNPDREQQCVDVNAKIDAETDRLRTCESASECGKQLPTLGSCGCTHNFVGRLDADTSKLEALFTQRAELSDVSGCEDLGGTCDCPNQGGVDCVQQRSEWVDIADEDPCIALDGTFKSVEELECGLTPDGVALCNWSLTFTMGMFTWHYSDIGDAGSYKCQDGAIIATTGGGSQYAGTITNDGKLTFDGVAYERAP